MRKISLLALLMSLIFADALAVQEVDNHGIYVVNDENAQIKFPVCPNEQDKTFIIYNDNDYLVYAVEEICNKFTGEPTGKYPIDVNNVVSLENIKTNATLKERLAMSGGDTIYMVDKKLVAFKTKGFTMLFEDDVTRLGHWDEKPLDKDAFHFLWNYINSDSYYRSVYSIINSISYKGKTLDKVKSRTYGYSYPVFMLNDSTFVELNSQRVGVIQAVGTYISVNGDRSNINTIYHGLDSYPVSLTDNGKVREIRMSNGDYLKFSQNIDYKAFEGKLHFPSGLLTISNDGESVIGYLDVTAGPDSGFTRVINVDIKDPSIRAKRIDYTPSILNYMESESQIFKINPIRYYVTDTKEEAVDYDGKLLSKNEALRKMMEAITVEGEPSDMYAIKEEDLDKQTKTTPGHYAESNSTKTVITTKTSTKESIVNSYSTKYGSINVNNALKGIVSVNMPLALVKTCFKCVQKKHNSNPGLQCYEVTLAKPVVNEKAGIIECGTAVTGKVQILVGTGKVRSVQNL